MKIKELRAKSLEDLKVLGRDMRQELFNLRLRQTTGQLEKPSRLNDLRKDIARVETLLSQSNKSKETK